MKYERSKTNRIVTIFITSSILFVAPDLTTAGEGGGGENLDLPSSTTSTTTSTNSKPIIKNLFDKKRYLQECRKDLKVASKKSKDAIKRVKETERKHRSIQKSGNTKDKKKIQKQLNKDKKNRDIALRKENKLRDKCLKLSEQVKKGKRQ